ncbi:hypothetical protein SAMN04488074_12133 [Lentzea albidocapillata subsp. violacea]|uniref:Uncharacterized protein n=1 Tax=Lentzea albidocapillata subsp. violacea TaxID=128104 RepID=A0A1G9SZJ2_9PSEU|nr:hypothetical protein [Lentzea albidocapillata]SDM40864.1 hypothetical protein SAMN04488074_12133 [Lentzea albidocapillata subsp. violacea]
MESSDETFGTSALSMEVLRQRLERVLSVRFQPHDSSYFGGDYYRCEAAPEEEMILFRNDVPDEEGEVVQPQNAQYSVLFEVMSTSRGDELRAALSAIPELTLIRQERY